MAKFNIGDKIRDNKFPYIYTIRKIDKQNEKYYIVSNDGFSMWSSCIGYEKVPTHNDALRYGEVLTDDRYTLNISWHYRIRTIRYESRIFYHKMVNGEVVEFKELTT